MQRDVEAQIMPNFSSKCAASAAEDIPAENHTQHPPR